MADAVPDVRRRVCATDGGPLSYLEAGPADAPVLLLLHGGALGETASTAWGRVLAPLSARRRVLAPDWPGFGGSAKVRDTADLAGGLLRPVAAMLAALGVAPVDAVGQSMGGAMLLRDAASPAPLLPVRRRVLVSAGGPALGPDVWQRLMDFDGTVDAMRRLVALGFADERWQHDEPFLAERVEAARVPGTYEFLASVPLRAPWAPPPPAGDPVPYERVAGPTLVVAGARDRLKPDGWHAEVVRRLPDGRADVVASAGHNPQVEAPEQFCAAVLGFLDESAPQRPREDVLA